MDEKDTNNKQNKPIMKKKCSLMCPEFGYCNNRLGGEECGGFVPMDSEEESYDPMEEKIERTTY